MPLKTYLYSRATLDDLPKILSRSELANQLILDIRLTEVEFLDEVTMMMVQYPRVEIDAKPNPEGGQVILPTTAERLQAAETLINLILDEEEV